MYNHAPNNYECPICLAIAGKETDATWIKQDDIFYQDNLATAFISAKAIKGNEGHPLIVPNKHFENIYDLPENIGHHISDLAKKAAIALKAVRNCDGVNIFQSNEPAASQHAFHYHLHVIPRFENDNFNEEFWEAKNLTQKTELAMPKPFGNILKTSKTLFML